MLKVCALAIVSMLFLISGLYVQTSLQRDEARREVWRLQGETDAKDAVIAKLKAEPPPIVCADYYGPYPPAPPKVTKKKAEKRVTPVFGRW